MQDLRREGPYRKEALQVLSSPDQLGQSLSLVRPAWTIGLGALAGAVLLAIVAAAYVKVPIVVKASGIVLSSKGVLEVAVTAQHEGRIASIQVEEGDHVAPDDVIARVELPEVRAEFALVDAERRQIEEELENIRRVQGTQASATRALNALNRKAMDDSVQLLADRLKTLEVLRDNVDQLRRNGYVSIDRALQIRSEVADTRERLASKRSGLVTMSVEEQQQVGQFTREMFALQARLSVADRQLARLREQLRREVVRSNDYGVVSEVKVAPGDLTRFDTPIVSMLPTDFTFSRDRPGPTYLVVSVFVPARDGKKVRPGMDVLVDPTSVRHDIYGNMVGRVTTVSDTPLTAERLRKMLRNDALVRQVTQDGAPFLAQVTLQRDRRNASGFAWTSSSGPPQPITAGTLASTEIMTERVTLLSLLVPALRELLRAEERQPHAP